MKGRTKVLFIAIPVLFAILVGVITTLSLPIFTLGPEQISIYDTTYENPDFTVFDVRVKYYDADELTVWFYITGGDAQEDLRFEFICLDSNKDFIYSGSNSGNVTVETAGYSSGDPEYSSNSTTLYSGTPGTLVIGVLEWVDVPAGNQRIKAVIDLPGIAVDTESFHIELRQIN